MTCGGDGKATWMCNFVVKSDVEGWGGSPYTGLLLSFGSMPLVSL